MYYAFFCGRPLLVCKMFCPLLVCKMFCATLIASISGVVAGATEFLGAEMLVILATLPAPISGAREFLGRRSTFLLGLAAGDAGHTDPASETGDVGHTDPASETGEAARDTGLDAGDARGPTAAFFCGPPLLVCKMLCPTLIASISGVVAGATEFLGAEMLVTLATLLAPISGAVAGAREFLGRRSTFLP